ncbi:carbohydrate ABC transporter permease [Umezawaea tangerina]|uniref:Carbohydrate ABC transporter membrane protein 2 (CUT1 family) n=1 Tax=Umezawaea tangerina TaxID=84725 RepID=A0A2T0SYY9_9PSEU|nr:carbohydrate ABC transporter permease [Umezawaea tangerina]PRY38632.1 carbohydrate ABC transporter membrane protein 2 (CUT1 family) [Umezawaea tangerina]
MTALQVRRRSRRPSALHLILLPISLVMIAPLVWMVLVSFSTQAEARRFPPGLPSGLEWHNYADAWNDVPLGSWLYNSTVVSVVCVVGNLVLCSLAGYAFARIRFIGGRVAFLAILATLMVPFQIVMLPLLIMVREVGLSDTLGALIAPNLATAFGVFLMRQFFMTVPRELEEAARIDGASRLRILLQVLLPLMRPTLATLAVLTFLQTWNDFLWPLIAIHSPGSMTVQIGLQSFQGAHTTNWPKLMAGTVLSQVPVLLVFFVAQRFFVRSVASVGIK